MNRIAFILTISFSLSLQAWETQPPPSVLEAKQMSTAIFIGAVETTRKGKESSEFISGLGCAVETITKFSVKKMWKGQKSEFLEVRGCYSFKEGAEYLVYALGPEGELSVQPFPQNKGNRSTSLLSEAVEDILTLGKPNQ